MYTTKLSNKEYANKIRRGFEPFKNVEILDAKLHGNLKYRHQHEITWLAGMDNYPLLVAEFPRAQAFQPILFSGFDDRIIPVAMFGLNGINAFMDADGSITEPVYVPAMAQSHPFIISNEFEKDADGDHPIGYDVASDRIGEFDIGEPLFVDGRQSEFLEARTDFCKWIRHQAAETFQFMEQLRRYDLLKKGEMTLLASDGLHECSYPGFTVIDEDKLDSIPPKDLHELHQRGFLAPIYAHLASLQQLGTLLQRDIDAGRFTSAGASLKGGLNVR
jgi:hypothetical protein